jgi:propanediol utilization protein
MQYKALQIKLDKIKRALDEYYQDENAVSAGSYDHLKLQIEEYEELIGPGMDEAEMNYVEGQLNELALKLGI